MDEKLLLDRLRRDDPEARAQLWRDYSDSLFRYICFIVRTPLVTHPSGNRSVIADSDAHDVLVETFLAAFKDIKKFKGKCKLKTWLYSIATRRAADFYRDEERQRFQLEESAIEDDSADIVIQDEIGTHRGPLEPEVGKERIQPKTRALAVRAAISWNSGASDPGANGITNLILLQSAMSELTAQQRQVIVMQHDGNTYKEIGVALGVSEGAAKMAYGRGIKALQRSTTKESADNRAEANPQ